MGITIALFYMSSFMGGLRSSSGVKFGHRGLFLDRARRGSRCIVLVIPNDGSRTQLIRLGLVEGEEIRVVERMPGGTIVIEKNRREIAIGAALARTIRVEALPKPDAAAYA